jgi:hypothetical protein
MPDLIDPDMKPHHAAEELLPWYVTGQLEGDELALVEQHLSSCAHCRRQLAFEKRMVHEFASFSPEVDNGWARLKERLEPGHEPLHHSPLPRPRLWDQVVADARALWGTLSRPAIAALATAEVAFVGLAGTALYTLSQPAYQTLGSTPPPRSANAIAMFKADTTSAQMADLLRENGASLVGGPTETDAYLLDVPAKSREEALTHLRTDRHVLLAQPIDGPRS